MQNSRGSLVVKYAKRIGANSELIRNSFSVLSLLNWKTYRSSIGVKYHFSRASLWLHCGLNGVFEVSPGGCLILASSLVRSVTPTEVHPKFVSPFFLSSSSVRFLFRRLLGVWEQPPGARISVPRNWGLTWWQIPVTHARNRATKETKLLPVCWGSRLMVFRLSRIHV